MEELVVSVEGMACKVVLCKCRISKVKLHKINDENDERYREISRVL